jgi:hypothetical protein
MSDSKRLLSGEGDALERALLESAEIAEPTTAAREAIWAGLAARLTAAPPARGVEGGLEGHGMAAMGGRAGLSVVTRLTLVSVTCMSLAGALAGALVLRTAHRTASFAASRAADETALPPAGAPAPSMTLTSPAPSPSLENGVRGDRFVAGTKDAARAAGEATQAPAESRDASQAPAESRDASRAPAESRELAGHPAGAAPSDRGGAPDVASPSRPAALRVARSSLAGPGPAVSLVIAKGAVQAAPAPSAAKPNDAALLLAARSSLRAGSCAEALAQLEEMAGRFPTSVFTQEREAMAIEALDCAGHNAEAADLAARFLHDHPASPYADAVRSRR